MGRTVRLQDEKHWELQSLLPWYASGRLDPDERARVDEHLRTCEDCREELRFEQTLARSVRDRPLDADFGGRSRVRRRKSDPRRAGHPSAWASWAVGAVVLAEVAFTVLPHGQAGARRLLGAAAPATPGDLVVVFKPDARERDIREALGAAGARIVDGPTASDAYVLATPAAQRATALARLRASPGVVMAEPVDPAPGP